MADNLLREPTPEEHYRNAALAERETVAMLIAGDYPVVLVTGAEARARAFEALADERMAQRLAGALPAPGAPMVGFGHLLDGWPTCPTCGEPAAEQIAQRVTRHEPGSMRDRETNGQQTSRCPNGHWFNENGEVSGPPPDIRIEL